MYLSVGTVLALAISLFYMYIAVRIRAREKFILSPPFSSNCLPRFFFFFFFCLPLLLRLLHATPTTAQRDTIYRVLPLAPAIDVVAVVVVVVVVTVTVVVESVLAPMVLTLVAPKSQHAESSTRRGR